MVPTRESERGPFLHTVGKISQGKNLSFWLDLPRAPQIQLDGQSLGGQDMCSGPFQHTYLWQPHSR